MATAGKTADAGVRFDRNTGGSASAFVGDQAIEFGADICHAPGNGHTAATVGVEHPQREGLVGPAT